MTNVTMILGDCLSVMRTLEADSVDSIVCDPPYMINFMNKTFDRAKNNPAASVEVWAEALRVAKPGAMLLAFGGTRTHHRLMVAIEDAGWEIRDCLMWLYGSGFPKSANVSKLIDRAAGAEREVVGRDPYYSPGRKQTFGDGNKYGTAQGGDEETAWLTAPATDAARTWDGWGTALKPAWEPIIMARKPLSEPSIAANVLRWGTGALAIDKCRIGTDEDFGRGGFRERTRGYVGIKSDEMIPAQPASPQGRWPANLILDDQAAALLDEMSGERKSGGGNKSRRGTTAHTAVYGTYNAPPPDIREVDVGHASRFFLRVAPDPSTGSGQADEPLRMFYCGKASKRDRDEGLEGMPETERKGESIWAGECPQCGCRMMLNGKPTCGHGEVKWVQGLPRRNHHPTVKPTALMRWLVRLVTPPGGTVLDCFCGSGSTGKATVLEGFDFVGIDNDAEYLEIAAKRIEHAQAQMQMQMPMPFVTLYQGGPEAA